LQCLTAEPRVQFPHLTKTTELESQGLVAHDLEGLSFCKNWNSVTMYSFFKQHLPRPFQYFEEQGFKEPTISKPSALPFCILERTPQREYAVAKPPVNGPTGKFYQNKATGTQGAGYKGRKIVLSKSAACDPIVVNLTCIPVSKRPIPQHVLNKWKRNPLPTENRLGGPEPKGEVEVVPQVQGSGKLRPKPRKG